MPPQNSPLKKSYGPGPVTRNYLDFSKGKRLTHLDKLPFWKRYQKGLVFGGAFLSFLIVYSAPIYHFFRTPPEVINPYDTMWPGEIAAGKSYTQQFKEREEKRRQQKEKAEALKQQAEERRMKMKVETEAQKSP